MKKLLIIGTILMFSMVSAVAFADSNTGMMGQGYGYGMMGSGAVVQSGNRAVAQNNGANGQNNGAENPGYGYYGPGYGYGMRGQGRSWRGYGYGMMGPGYGYGMMGAGCGYGFGALGYGMRGHGYGYPGNVSREDLEKIYKAREDFFKDTQALREKIYEKRSALYAELVQKDPNAKKVSALQKELSSVEAEFAQKRIDYQLKLRKLLPKWEGFQGESGTN